MRGMWAIVALDMKRYFQEPMRLFPGLIQPLLYLFVLGSGLAASMGKMPATGDYRGFIFPGIITLSLLFTATFAGISIVFDRQIGFFKAVLVAPVARESIAAGKIAAGALQALIQGGLLLFVVPFMHLNSGITGVLLLIPAMVLTALTFSAMGVALAARFTSATVFPVVINTVILPMYFLSGAMYPLKPAPGWMQKLAHLDPVAYGVDLLRGALLGRDSMFFDPLLSITVLTVVLVVLAWVSVGIFKRGEESDLTGPSKFPWRK